MTEAEWLTCDDPRAMLTFLHGVGCTTKFEAFAEACFTLHRIPLDWRVEEAPLAVQVRTIRCLVANPFRPVTFSPSWRTDTAVALAAQMYESRDFSAMPILADALQDAGCDSTDILVHCRDTNATHVRGCWVVDLVLGKKLTA